MYTHSATIAERLKVSNEALAKFVNSSQFVLGLPVIVALISYDRKRVGRIRFFPIGSN